MILDRSTRNTFGLRFVQSKRKPRNQGFTLLEMMLVLAILGVLFAVGFDTFARQSWQSTIRQGAVQIQADLEQLRSNSIRYNANFEFRLLSAKSGQYSIDVPSATGPTPQTRNLPTGVSLNVARLPLSATAKITYTSPLAVVKDAVDRVFQVEIVGVRANPLFVKVLGVTGRVGISVSN